MPTPIASYDPRARLILEPAPWLLFAAVMRILEFEVPDVAVVPSVLAEAGTLLAFMSAAGRMIEIFGGSTPLSRLEFGDQLRFVKWADVRIAIVLFMAAGVFRLLGYVFESGFLLQTSPHLQYGFDGFAFDQATDTGRFWSGLLAAATLVVVVERAAGRPVDVLSVAARLCARWRYLITATICVGVFMMAFTLLQGQARSAVLSIMAGELPAQIKNVIFLGFVFVFAFARLLVTLAILCLALRRSYEAENSASL